MADDSGVVGKVSIRVYPDTDFFARRLAVFLTRVEKSERVDIEIHPDEDGFVQKVRQIKRRAERTAGDIKIRVDVRDHDELNRQLKNVRERLRDLGRVELRYASDKKGLEQAQRELEMLRQHSRIHLDIVEDVQGWTEARNKLAAILRERMVQRITVEPDDESIRRAMANFDKKIADATPSRKIELDVEVDNDALARNLKSVERALAELDHPKIPVEFDRDSLLAERRRLQDEIANRPIELKYRPDEEGYRRALREVDERLRSFEREITLEVDNDVVSLRKTRHELQEILDDFDGRKVEFKAQADAWLARRELQYTARTRFVTLVVNVSKASVLRAEAVLRALSGFRFLERGLRRIWDNFKNIDKNIVIIGLITQAVAGLTGWLMAATSNIFSLSRGLAQIFGMGLLLPGVLAGFTAGIGASVAVLKDMTLIVPELNTMFNALQDNMSFRFWSRFERPFRRMVDTLFPEFRQGLLITSDALGVWYSGFADAMRTQLRGSMGVMFARLAESILISAQNTETFVSIIETLGRKGADVLPRLARWWNDVTTNFDTWLTSTQKSGRLDEIIETAIQNARDLGWVFYHTGGMLAGLARAAEQAGGSTLSTLATKMERIHRAVDRPLFQEGLIRALRSAHEAMDMISRESGPRVTEFFKNLSRIMENSFQDVGATIGLLIGGIAESFSTVRFSGGLMDFLAGLRDMAQSLDDAWAPLGDGLGALGELLATFARQFGPILGEMFKQLSDAMGTLGPTLEGWIIALSNRLLPIMEVMGPVVIGLAEGFAALLTPLIELPGLVELFFAALIISRLSAAVGGITGIVSAIGPLRNLFRNTATAAGAFWRSLSPWRQAGVGIGIAGAIGAVAFALSKAFLYRDVNVSSIADDYDRLTLAMLRSGEEMTRTSEITAGFGGNLQDVADSMPIDHINSYFEGLTSHGSELEGVDALVRNLGFSTGDLSHGMGALGRTWSMLTLQTDKFGPVKEEMEAAAAQTEQFDKALAAMVQDGNLTGAAMLQQEFARAAERLGLSADWAADQLPAYALALERAGIETAEMERMTRAADNALTYLHGTFQDLGFGTPALVQAIQDGAQAFIDIGEAISQVDEKMAELEKTATLDDYAKALEKQVEDQRKWADNMAILTERGVDEGVLMELARLGPEGERLIALMVDGTEEEIARIEQAVKDGMVGPIGATRGEFAKMVEAAREGLRELSPEAKAMLAELEPELLASMTPLGLALMLGAAEGIDQGAHIPMDATREAAANIGRGFADVMRIASPSGLFRDFGGFLMAGLGIGIVSNTPGVMTTVSTVALGITNLFQGSGTWLLDAGKGLIGGLINGIASRGGDSADAGLGIKGRIGGAFSDALSFLFPSGGGLIGGLIGGMNSKRGETTTSITSLRDRTKTPFSSATSFLRPDGSNLIQGLIAGISGMLRATRVAVTAIRSGISGVFSGAGTLLSGAGARAISGLVSALSGGLRAVRSVMGAVRGAITVNANLYGRGASIMASLANGLASGIGRIRTMLRNLTASIPSWKGPASTDSVLLYDAGRLIIGGLVAGLESQYAGVYQSLQGLSRGIEGVKIGGPSLEEARRVQASLRGAQGHMAVVDGRTGDAGDHIEFHGNVGMDPNDVAEAIEWRKRRQAMRMGMGAIARGV